jgi:hypothetical protein
MSGQIDSLENQQQLERLGRESFDMMQEVSIVTSPGAKTTSWAVKVESSDSYNVYNVRIVEIGEPGLLPAEIGNTMQAVNLAESFLQTGQLPAGTYAVMSRVGSKNVFYAPV